MITDVPALMAVTRPVAAPTVATAGVALVQVPPGVVLVQTAVAPIHKGVVPVIV